MSRNSDRAAASDAVFENPVDPGTENRHIAVSAVQQIKDPFQRALILILGNLADDVAAIKTNLEGRDTI